MRTPAQVRAEFDARIESIQAEAVDRLPATLRDMLDDLADVAWNLGSWNPRAEVSRALSDLMAHDKIELTLDRVLKVKS